MLTYADECWHMLAYATYADVCGRMRTYTRVSDRCLLAARRFTPQSYQEPSPGLDSSGCVKPLIANTSWHLGSPPDDCDTTCARLAPPDPLLRGAWECVGIFADVCWRMLAYADVC
jgi:hypothetical protein